MKLYLVRHGEAVSEAQDPSRPLSKRGAGEVEALARLLAWRFAVMPGHLFHSSRSRAAQTAAIISEALPLALVPRPTEGLGPADDPAHWAEKVETMDRDIMLVGHLPHLSRLASLLLLWDAGREVINFSTGTVLCLEKTGSWKVKWMISPDTLKDL